MIDGQRISHDLLESRLELPGNCSVVLGLPHDLADEPLLAVKIVVVELLIQVLEHGDPLDNVEGVAEVTILSRPTQYIKEYKEIRILHVLKINDQNKQSQRDPE